MKNNLKRMMLISSLATSLAACSGGGSSSNNNGGGNQGDATQLTFVAPNIVPSLAGGTANGYIVVKNPTSSVVTGIRYTLGNIIGDAAKVTLDPVSSTNCAEVAANSSCTIKLTVPANTLAGSFNISANNKSLLRHLSDEVSSNKKSLAANLPTDPTIGVGQVLYTTTTGANGVTLYYYNTIVAGVPAILVSGVVSSNQVGSLNNVVLVDGNNNPLPNQQVISGNLGAGATNLGLGSTFSILLPAPSASGATQTIKVKTEQVTADGSVSNIQISTNSSTLTTTTGVGIANMLPQAIYLTAANPEQQITFSNTGDAAAQLQSLVASNPNIEIVFNPTSLSPSSVSSATLRLKNGATTATSSSITLNYNNGVTDKSQSASVDQNVVPGPTPGPSPTPTPTPDPKPVIVAGLTATLASNNFNVTTVNHTTIESMTITNTGNTTENTFVATLPSNFSLVDNAGSATDCKVVSGAIDASQTLAPYTNCSVNVKYDSTTVGSGTTTISIAYKYNGTAPAPSPATAAVNWQVTQSTANLIVTGSVPQPYVFAATLVDGNGVSYSNLFTIQNTGDNEASSITSVVNNTTTAGLFAADNGDASPVCGATLAAGSSCQLGVQFGPIPDNESAGAKNGNLVVSYRQYSTATTIESVTQNVQGQVANSGSAIFDAPPSGTATGFSNNNWANLTIGQDVTTGLITYTITNTGGDAATNFIVTLPAAPTGWSSIATTCPTATGTNLAINDSCNVTIAPDTSGGNIAATNFTLALVWSDQDSPNGESQNLQIATPAVTVIPKAAIITAESSGATGFKNNGWNSLSINQYATSGLITYTISNGGNAPATNFIVTLPAAPTGWSSINTTCPTATGSNLAINATCNVTLGPDTSALGSIAESSFTLDLAWSDPANPTGKTQSNTLATPGVTVVLAPFTFSNPYGITINPAGTYAFIVNSTASTVTQCSVSESNLVNCADSGAALLSTPRAITISPDGNYAYITNQASSAVTKCNVSGGTLSGCANSGATGITNPFGISLNPAGTYAFISNLGGTVTQCSVSGGAFSSCSNSGATSLSLPASVTLNSAGTYAFFANYSNDTVTQCSVSGGVLSNCADSGATGLSEPNDLVFDSSGTYAFISNHADNTVVRCSVSGNALSSCTDSGATTLNGPRYIAFNSTGNYAFITGTGNNTITQCSVSNGVLSNCAQTGFK